MGEFQLLNFFFALLVTSAVTFLVLTIAHIFIVNYVPWSLRAKLFRNVVFASVCWPIFAFFLVILFDPYDRSFDDMRFDQIVQMLSFIFVVPALISAGLYIYKSYVEKF